VPSKERQEDKRRRRTASPLKPSRIVQGQDDQGGEDIEATYDNDGSK
jgi:hypothetical protein